MKAAPSGGLNKSAPNSRASAAFSLSWMPADFLLGCVPPSRLFVPSNKPRLVLDAPFPLG